MSTLYVTHSEDGLVWHWFMLSRAGQFIARSVNQFKSKAEAEAELRNLADD